VPKKQSLHAVASVKQMSLQQMPKVHTSVQQMQWCWQHIAQWTTGNSEWPVTQTSLGSQHIEWVRWP